MKFWSYDWGTVPRNVFFCFVALRPFDSEILVEQPQRKTESTLCGKGDEVICIFPGVGAAAVVVSEYSATLLRLHIVADEWLHIFDGVCLGWCNLSSQQRRHSEGGNAIEEGENMYYGMMGVRKSRVADNVGTKLIELFEL